MTSAKPPDKDPLKPLCDVLSRAFPHGVPQHLYTPLISVLREEMSFRSIARALEMTFGTDYIKALNDAYGAQPLDALVANDLQEVQERLQEGGYNQLPDE